MTNIQRLLRRKRDSNIICHHIWGDLEFFTTEYNKHRWLLRIDHGLTKWFMSEQAAIDYAFDYLLQQRRYNHTIYVDVLNPLYAAHSH